MEANGSNRFHPDSRERIGDALSKHESLWRGRICSPYLSVSQLSLIALAVGLVIFFSTRKH